MNMLIGLKYHFWATRVFSGLLVVGLMFGVAFPASGLADPAMASESENFFPERFFQVLPTSTVLVIATDDAGQTLQGLEGTGLAGALNKPEFQSFLSAAREVEPLFDPTSFLPLPWQAAVDLLGDGAFGLVALEVDDQLSELALVLEIQGRADAWKAMVATELANAQKLGRSVSQKVVDGITVEVINGAPAPLENIVFCQLDDWLIICESEAAVGQFITAGKLSADKKLTADSRYLQTIGKLQGAPQDAGKLWIFIEPLRADYLRARSAGWPETDISRTFGARHGFDAVRSIGGWAVLGQQQHDALYQFRLWIEPPIEKGMKLLQFQTRKESAPSTWVPAKDVSSYATVGWDFSPVLDHAGPLVNELIEDITGKSDQTFERFLKQLEAEDGPGINLQQQFMPLLGERLEYISIFVPPASTTAEQSIVAFELNPSVPDVAAEVADLVELLVDSGNTLMIPIPGYPYPLWKLGGGQRAGSGPSFSTPGVMVAQNRLFVASNFNAIRQYMAVAKPLPGLADAQRFQQVQQVLEGVAGKTPAVRIVAFPAQDFENTYELLRSGRVDQAESVYTMLLSPLLKDNKDKLPFEKLPPFGLLKSVLGATGIQLNLVENGWELHGFNLRAGQ